MNKELRFAKTQKKLEEFYAKYPDVCFICKRKPKNEFKYWKIIANVFPYDKIASRHDMLVPLRHIGLEGKFTGKEKNELIVIKEKTLPKMDYDWIMEMLPRKKSAPAHFHLHLIKHK
jgi:hypothetical protein